MIRVEGLPHGGFDAEPGRGEELGRTGKLGRNESFERCFAELYVLAKRPARRILGDPTEAEDVAAETLARLYLDWHKLDGDPGGWVVRVATNLAIDQVRRRRRSDRLLPRPVAVDAVDADRVLVAGAVARLPRRQRQVVSLRYFADMADAQIAQALNLGVATVRTHLQRARVALAAELGSPRGALDDLD